MKRFLTTKIQDHILRYWDGYQRAHGHPPTMEQARIDLGYSSTSSVQRHLIALGKKGLMTRAPHRFWYVAGPKWAELHSKTE